MWDGHTVAVGDSRYNKGVSEFLSDSLPPQELKRLLMKEPYLVQRLGMVANNAGIITEFLDMVRNGQDCEQMRRALMRELESRGVKNAEDLMTLFDIPDGFED